MCIEHMFINIKIRGRENLIFPQLQWKTTYFFIDILELFSSNSWKLVKNMMMKWWCIIINFCIKLEFLYIEVIILIPIDWYYRGYSFIAGIILIPI